MYVQFLLQDWIHCLHIWIFHKCLPCPLQVCSCWSHFYQTEWLFPQKKSAGQQNSTGFEGITAHGKAGLKPLPGRLELKCTEWKQLKWALSSSLCNKRNPHLSAVLFCWRSECGDPDISGGSTVVRLCCSLTCRLTGYHGVGHGCRPMGESQPDGPPASFKDTTVRVRAVDEREAEWKYLSHEAGMLVQFKTKY